MDRNGADLRWKKLFLGDSPRSQGLKFRGFAWSLARPMAPLGLAGNIAVLVYHMAVPPGWAEPVVSERQEREGGRGGSLLLEREFATGKTTLVGSCTCAVIASKYQSHTTALTARRCNVLPVHMSVQ